MTNLTPGLLASRHTSPVDEKYISTVDQLRDLWMKRMAYANVPEKIEYELGFQVFLDRITGTDPTAADPATTEPEGSTP